MKKDEKRTQMGNEALIEIKKFQNDLKNIGGISKGVKNELCICSDRLKDVVVETLKGDMDLTKTISLVDGFKSTNKNYISDVQSGKVQDGNYLESLLEFKEDLLGEKERIRLVNIGFNEEE